MVLNWDNFAPQSLVVTEGGGLLLAGDRDTAKSYNTQNDPLKQIFIWLIISIVLKLRNLIESKKFSHTV